MSSIADMKIGDFLNALSEPSAEFGGGSAVLTAASMGASLAAMAVGISCRRIKDEETLKILEEKASFFKESSKQFLEYASEDGHSYDDVLKARRMPKDTEEESKLREEAVEKALLKSVDIPIKACELCIKTVESMREIKSVCSKNCISDLTSAVSLIRDGALGCIVNIVQNASGLKNPMPVMEKVSQLTLKVKIVSADVINNMQGML